MHGILHMSDLAALRFSTCSPVRRAARMCVAEALSLRLQMRRRLVSRAKSGSLHRPVRMLRPSSAALKPPPAPPR